MKRFAISLFALLAVSTACQNQQGSNTATAPAQPSSPSAPAAAPTTSGSSTVLARVNGEDITDAEVTERVKNRIKKIESQLFDIKRDGLDEVIEEKLLASEAKKRGVSLDELLKVEVQSKVSDPTESELQTYYTLFKKRFNDEPLEKVKPAIVRQIKGTKERQLYTDFIDGLRKSAEVAVLMERPRVEVSVDDDPSRGPKDAPITIVEFSEFQCPFCKRARPTLDKIMETYKDKIHYVFRDFPLSFHKQAPKAAQAAHCAGDQGKYWEYSDKLWDNQSNIQEDALKKYAGELKLDEKKFNECLSTDKYAAEIEKDTQDGMQAGVSGTPAYFINGVFISGAQPFENFKQVIDEELARKK